MIAQTGKEPQELLRNPATPAPELKVCRRCAAVTSGNGRELETKHVQMSIGKLAVTLIILLITVTLVTTGIGLFTLHGDYRTLASRHDAEAHDTVRNAALSIRNQIHFYQGILQLVSSKPEVANLLEFGDTAEITEWADNLRRILPGTLGTALTSEHGELYGDPTAQRVGPRCVLDMQTLVRGEPIEFPPLHTDVPGLEHFDLLTQVTSPSGDKSGTLFVSFRLSVLEELLHSMSTRGDRFELRNGAGEIGLATGPENPSQDASTYRMRVPDTSWELLLHRRVPVNSDSLMGLIGADALILTLSGILVVVLIRNTLGGFRKDMTRVHTALTDVLDGHYHPISEPTAIKETRILLPDIEQLALRLQDQRNELRHQSLSDPLTGVFNRRYFDMMLAHLHEQSRRQSPAYLVIIDLNDFKQVNDEFGHQTGDRVLQATAQYLLSRIRATDIVARLGGDEFALLLTHMAREGLEDWIVTLLEDYDRSELQSHGERAIFCRLSVGITAIDAGVYAAPQDVFDAADRIMYDVKQRRELRASHYAVSKDAPMTDVTAVVERQ